MRSITLFCTLLSLVAFSAGCGVEKAINEELNPERNEPAVTISYVTVPGGYEFTANFVNCDKDAFAWQVFEDKFDAGGGVDLPRGSVEFDCVTQKALIAHIDPNRPLYATSLVVGKFRVRGLKNGATGEFLRIFGYQWYPRIDSHRLLKINFKKEQGSIVYPSGVFTIPYVKCN